MRVSPKKENWKEYSSKLTLGYLPRIIWVALTRPVSAYKKATYMLKERRSYQRLLKTSAGPAIQIISKRNQELLGTDTGQYSDIWRLYQHVMRIGKPVAWEFGPGWTTIGLAAAMLDSKEIENGKVYTIETNKEWYEWYKETFSKLDPKLQKVIELIYSPVEIISDKYDQPAVRHTVLPEQYPYLIHVDGGNTTDIKVSCDILDNEDSFPSSFTVVFDGRVENFKFLQRNLKRPYKHQKSLFSKGLVQPVLKVG